ncbi:serine hydrolase domain-containing protein [Streptomyces formicae]|uniref:Esterase A n=1 Tax=Streptomyces formicae TaxID=1616117 RepID=A0A291Q9K4_9ACTN|nr:serine hydrolase domain-containing protein [Streptomyces formicae]ATL28379.1 Esterase A [Streptomyces formicae]
MDDVIGGVHGTAAAGFEAVRDAFVRNFGERGERGAAVTVYRDGRKVVDLWGGTKDVDGVADGPGSGTEPWEHGTAQIVRSATKGVAAAALLLLHQRGDLDLDAPVGAYWPEFKARGKEHVLVRHVLAHRAGVPALDRPLTPTEALDPDLAAAAVAAQAPFWEPGTGHGYHAHTYGWLTGELVRRVTGRPVGEWIAAEIARPLGLDLWVGLPDAEAARAGRVGRIEPPEAAGGLRVRPKRNVADAYADPASLTRRAFGTIDPTPDENDPAYRAAALPASNGIATADALARFYAALIGEVDGGTRLFTPETVEAARAEASAGPDRVLVVNTRFGLGYMLHGGASPLLGPGSFGHPGRGGALGFADPESGVAFGYVTNGLAKGVTADPRAQALVRAVRSAL